MRGGWECREEIWGYEENIEGSRRGIHELRGGCKRGTRSFRSRAREAGKGGGQGRQGKGGRAREAAQGRQGKGGRARAQSRGKGRSPSLSPLLCECDSVPVREYGPWNGEGRAGKEDARADCVVEPAHAHLRQGRVGECSECRGLRAWRGGGEDGEGERVRGLRVVGLVGEWRVENKQ